MVSRSIQDPRIVTLFTFSIWENLRKSVNQQYFKDRTESFDDYYPCRKDECNLLHVHNWIQFFVSMCNDTSNNNDFELKEISIILN